MKQKLNTLYVLALVAILSLASCYSDPNYDPHNTPTVRYLDYNHKTKSGKIIRYYEDGRKKSMGYHKYGKKDSIWITWHYNGNKDLELSYKLNKKNGLYKNYRKTGELYREIEYVKNRKHGMYREYWKNGKIKYELEYDRGMKLSNTLVEFTKDGEIKPDKYLVIEEENTVKKDGMYKIRVFFKDKPSKAMYFVRVDNRSYFLDKKNNVGVLEFPVEKGLVVMKRVEFEGFYRGRKQIGKTVKRSFNIGVSNL